MTMSLLPVPFNPDTCQVSSILNSALGTSSSTGAGNSGTNAPSSAQSACRQPLEYCQRPASFQPPSTGSTFAPRGLKAELDQTSPPAKYSSWAASGESPTCQWWTEATE